MTKRNLQTQHVPKYTVAQGEVLDVIGDALKRRLIDFGAATTLRDLVRTGHVDEARKALDELASDSMQQVTAGSASPTVEL